MSATVTITAAAAPAPEPPSSGAASRADRDASSARRLATFLTVAGVSHFVVPKFYEAIVPRWIGHEKAVVRWSGVLEITSGVLVAVPKTRKVGAWLALLTFVGVYPANIQMAVSAGKPHDAESVGIWLRLPLQFPMFAWAYKHTR